MSGFRVEKLTAAPVIISDLGITIAGAAGSQHDLTHITPQDLARSADLRAAMATQIRVVDPRDDTNVTLLDQADSEEAVDRHNDTHLGVSGGRFGALDEPLTSVTDEDLVRYDVTTDSFEAVPASTVINNNSTTIAQIAGGMGTDGTDSTYTFDPTATILIENQDETLYDNVGNNGTFVGGDGAGGTAYAPGDTITMSDGSVITVDAVDGNGDVTQFTVTTTGATNVTPGAVITQTGTSGTGTSFTLTPENNNISDGTMSWSVNDAFLRNDGDTLDSGTLIIDSGAAVQFNNTSSLTIPANMSAATIETPGGGFSNDNDLINKGYVDSLAGGLDWKESARRSTTLGNNLGGFVNNGGVGDTITFNSTVTQIDGWSYTGNPATGLVVGDRILVKDQSTPSQNGIYVVTAGSTAASTILTRSTDQDGTPSSEISGGNTVFVETGPTHEKTIWSVIWDGLININTDPINWSQTGAVTDLLAGEGLNETANKFHLDISQLTGTATIGVADFIAFDDTTPTGVPTETDTRKTTVANFLSDLNIVTISTNGIIVNNGGTYTTVSIAVNGPGPLDGLAVANADGTAGNPTIGLDIQTLPMRAAVDAVNDRVAVWDQTANANVWYSVSDISGALASVNSFETWAAAGNTTGDGSIVADSATDTATLTGGIGVNIHFTSVSDTIIFDFARVGMADTAVVAAQDSIAFFDGSNANEPEWRGFDDLLDDLDIVHSITPNGIVVQTAADTYEGKSIVASTDEDEDGLIVTNGDGTAAGNMIVGLDIVGLNDPDDDMTATDEFPLHDKSEGTAGANQKITGQNIAEGVSNILNISGITISTINGQLIVTYTDTTRTEQLSIESHPYQFSDNTLSNDSWVSIGDAVDSDSGWVMPLDGTVVMATAHCENVPAGNTYDLDLYIDAADSGALGTLTAGANSEFVSTTLDIDVDQGEKLRVRADQTAGGGTLQDTTVVVIVRWRA